MRKRLLLASVLAMGALLAGCQSGTEGTPVTSRQSPTEPTVPTSRPTRTTAAPPKTISPSPPSTRTATPPAGAQPLPPNESGHVFVETKSGKTRCQLDQTEVGCEAPFTNTPMKDGVRANGVRLTDDGTVEWIVGNLGDIPTVTLDYKTYSAVGWTIEATEGGTRFTNQRTGHGMFVSIERVQTY
jgi:hypothetical protein